MCRKLNPKPRESAKRSNRKLIHNAISFVCLEVSLPLHCNRSAC